MALVVFTGLWALAGLVAAVTGGDLLDRMDKISSIAGAVAALTGIAAGVGSAGRDETGPQQPPSTVNGHDGRHRRTRLENARLVAERWRDEGVPPSRAFAIVMGLFVIYALVSKLFGR